MVVPLQVRELLGRALQEDVGSGDITTELTVHEEQDGKALILAKGRFVVAGLPFAQEVFHLIDNATVFEVLHKDSSVVEEGDVIAKVAGRTRTLLLGERLALNILQRLSGIATVTRSFVERVKDLDVRIVDTRKTTPGLRFMEKYAVRVGGGHNHRFGLYDGILIKDNHVKAAGGIAAAVRGARRASHLMKIEVEVTRLDELEEALTAGVDAVMLDNMPVEMMRKAVTIAKGRAVIEASGNVCIETVRPIAEAGVDLISIGALTHSAPAADISMKIVG